MDKKGGVSRFSFEKFLSHSAKKFVGEPFSVSLISSIENNFALEGYVKMFRRKIFVSQNQKLCRGTILRCVLESFRYRINLWMRSGGVSNSYVEFFCLTLSKTAVGELFSLSIISGIEKNWMRGWRGWSVKTFRRKFPVSQCRKVS